MLAQSAAARSRAAAPPSTSLRHGDAMMPCAASWLRAPLSTRLIRFAVCKEYSVRWLLASAPSTASLVQNGRTPLDCASTIECISVLLDTGATLGRPKLRDRPGPIHVAAEAGSEPLVRRLLDMGAAADSIDSVRSLLRTLRRSSRCAKGKAKWALPVCPLKQVGWPESRTRGCREFSIRLLACAAGLPPLCRV